MNREQAYRYVRIVAANLKGTNKATFREFRVCEKGEKINGIRAADEFLWNSTATDCRGTVVPLQSAHIAQMVEHVIGNDEVTGSIPVVGSYRKARRRGIVHERAHRACLRRLQGQELYDRQE